MRLFHGSTSVIEHPLVARSRDNLDFGKGFYLTSYQEQAASWALRRVNVEADIVNILAERMGLDVDGALRAYYESGVAEVVYNNKYGELYLDASYLADEVLRRINTR